MHRYDFLVFNRQGINLFVDDIMWHNLKRYDNIPKTLFQTQPLLSRALVGTGQQDLWSEMCALGQWKGKSSLGGRLYIFWEHLWAIENQLFHVRKKLQWCTRGYHTSPTSRENNNTLQFHHQVTLSLSAVHHIAFHGLGNMSHHMTSHVKVCA